ncbi:MAG: ketoacyl-ACP synthase III [Candidatus Bathyarchaeota archaeon]|nr:ketoacyl-ACP synthase III [Candidatus Bathyarchaeota archaeon]
MKYAGIKGTGMYVPPKVLSNDDLVAMGLDTSDEWISTKTGMKLRHVVEGDVCTSDLAAEAGKAAMKDARVRPKDVDMIIVATSSPDVILSSTAARTQSKMGCVNSGAFDVGSVCSGFVYAYDVGARMVMAPNLENVLVIGAETYSKILNWEDRTTCVYFGDGAGAVLLQKSEEAGYLGSYLRADGSGAEVIEIPAGGSLLPSTPELLEAGKQYFHMDGRAVWDFATVKYPEAVREAVRIAGYTLDDVDWVIPHQSNVNMIRVSMENAGLPVEKAYINLHKYANCAGASIPIALHEAGKDGSLKKGNLVVTCGYGGGLAWGANALIW